jgi:hypothetical protein
MYVPTFIVVDDLTWLMKNFPNSQQIQNRAAKTKKRIREPENNTSTERPRKRIQTQNRSQTRQVEEKRPREDEVPLVSPKSSTKRARTPTASVRKTISEARIEFWRENGDWPTEEQEKTMDRFRQLVNDARARKRSLSRKRSNASLSSETTPKLVAGSEVCSI